MKKTWRSFSGPMIAMAMESSTIKSSLISFSIEQMLKEHQMEARAEVHNNNTEVLESKDIIYLSLCFY